jgi:hypothetical protein
MKEKGLAIIGWAALMSDVKVSIQNLFSRESQEKRMHNLWPTFIYPHNLSEIVGCEALSCE